MVTIECAMCGTSHNIKVEQQDIVAWQQGELIQNAMPYLSVDERELLISRTCGSCFDSLWDGIRTCDSCGRETDAGEWPDWINGICERCDPDILTHPDNLVLEE